MKRIRRLSKPAAVAVVTLGSIAWACFGSGPTGSALAASERMPAVEAPAVLASAGAVEQAANQLTTGCNQITETGLPTGGKVGDWINAHIQPASAVIAVWHYDNPSQSYKAAFFQNPAVPVDLPTFNGPVDAFFVCVSASATAP